MDGVSDRANGWSGEDDCKVGEAFGVEEVILDAVVTEVCVEVAISDVASDWGFSSVTSSVASCGFCCSFVITTSFFSACRRLLDRPLLVGKAGLGSPDTQGS